MQVSVETLKGLERKVTISVPGEKVEEEVSQRLKKLARQVKVDGFRPGKVPLNVVTRRYADSVRQDVAKDMVQSTLFEALKEKSLVPAGYPSIEPEQLESGKDFCYSATFEVYPDIEITELGEATIELARSEVKDSDVETMIEKLREQHKTWQAVSRASVKGDKVLIDFEGFIDKEPFEGGKAEDYELELGSDSMIPGFEDQLVGQSPNQTFEIQVTFPESYGHETLAGRKAVFQIHLKQVMEGTLPPLDEAFAEQFNIKEGGVLALKQDIRENMARELERRLSSMNRETIFDKLLEKNAFELPLALIEQEISNLKHELFHRIFGHEHKDDEKIPDFPREMFEAQAKRRVHLGLLFSEYVKKHALTVDKARVDAMIDTLAGAYDNPDELRSWYQGSQERMAEIEALVMEEMVSEKIIEEATVVEKEMAYDDVLNPKEEPEKEEHE